MSKTGPVGRTIYRISVSDEYCIRRPAFRLYSTSEFITVRTSRGKVKRVSQTCERTQLSRDKVTSRLSVRPCDGHIIANYRQHIFMTVRETALLRSTKTLNVLLSKAFTAYLKNISSSQVSREQRFGGCGFKTEKPPLLVVGRGTNRIESV